MSEENETDLFGNEIENSREQIPRSAYTVKSEDVDKLTLMSRELIINSSHAQYFINDRIHLGYFKQFHSTDGFSSGYYALDLSEVIITAVVNGGPGYFITERQLIESTIRRIEECDAMISIKAFEYGHLGIFDNLEKVIEVANSNSRELNEVDIDFKLLYTWQARQLNHILQSAYE